MNCANTLPHGCAMPKDGAGETPYCHTRYQPQTPLTQVRREEKTEKGRSPHRGQFVILT